MTKNQAPTQRFNEFVQFIESGQEYYDSYGLGFSDELVGGTAMMPSFNPMAAAIALKHNWSPQAAWINFAQLSDHRLFGSFSRLGISGFMFMNRETFRKLSGFSDLYVVIRESELAYGDGQAVNAEAIAAVAEKAMWPHLKGDFFELVTYLAFYCDEVGRRSGSVSGYVDFVKEMVSLPSVHLTFDVDLWPIR